MPEYEPPVVFSGLAVVVASGTVISFDNSDVSIVFGPSTERLRAVFQFRDDTTEESRMDVQSSDLHEITLTLFNFKNVLGSGNQRPIKLGKLGGLTLYCNFLVHGYRDRDKLLHYTFYARDDDRLREIQIKALREMGRLSDR